MDKIKKTLKTFDFQGFFVESGSIELLIGGYVC